MGDDGGHPPPPFLDAALGSDVRAIFGDAGYRDRDIRDHLGANEEISLHALDRPVLEERIGEVGGPLGVLLGMFLLCRGTPLGNAETALGAEAIRALTASGLVKSTAGRLTPAVQLYTVEELIIAADLLERHAAKARDFVLGPFGVTLKLASFAFRRPVGSVLDLGCGSGTLAALAASHADRVVATDVNPRAVAFSRFNAELNGLDDFECREGSLFEPVSRERFDLILCNPPYVISPSETYVYRDGGTELCRQIVREAPDHLTEGGYLQMMVEWPERIYQDWRSEVSQWIDEGRCDAWLLRLYSYPAQQYAQIWLRQEYGEEAPPTEAVSSWTDHLAGLGVHSVGGGLLVLRRAGAEAPIRTIREAPRISPGPVGDAIGRWISSQSLLSSIMDRAELLDTRLVPAPGLERVERTTPTGEGWTTRSRELRIQTGLRFGANVDPVAEEIVGLLDGERTPREALELFAGRHGIGVEPFLDGLTKALAKLLELGLLVQGDSQIRPVSEAPTGAVG